MPGFLAPSGGALTPARLASFGQKFEQLARLDGVINRFLSRENWKSMAGVDVAPIGDVNNPRPSFAPIEVYTDTASNQGGDKIDIPVTGFLSGAPVGDAELEGLEEPIPISMRHLYLTLLRKAVAKAKDMQAQRLPQALLNAVNDSQSWLHDWYGRYWDGNYMHTLLTGYDLMLTTYREIDGQGSYATPFSHPNIYVAGHGQVTYTANGSGRPATSAYESHLVSCLNPLVDDETKGPTVDRVMHQQYLANKVWGIPQVKINGKPWTIWLVDPDWLYLLKQTQKWADYHKNANVRGMDNPLLSACDAYIEGNIFYSVPGMFGVQVSGGSVATQSGTSLTMPAYGPSGFWLSDDGLPVDTNQIKAAFIVGPGAIYKMYGRNRIEFRTNDRDYQHTEGVALHAYANAVRGDLFDARNDYGLGSNAFFRNYSSCVGFYNVEVPAAV